MDSVYIGLRTSGWNNQEYLTGIFALTDFAKPALGTTGNLGRNIFRGPGYAQVDSNFSKKFRVTEKLAAQLRLDAFNLFNRVNMSSPSLNINSNTFGRSTGARAPGRYRWPPSSNSNRR